MTPNHSLTRIEEGQITIGGRFDRLEEALLRIESKLDTKANVEDIHRLEKRLELLESGDSPGGRLFLERFRVMENDLTDVVRHGSMQAQSALKGIDILDTRLDGVERVVERANVVNQERTDGIEKQHRMVSVVFGGINVLVLTGNLLVTLVFHIH